MAHHTRACARERGREREGERESGREGERERQRQREARVKAETADNVTHNLSSMSAAGGAGGGVAPGGRDGLQAASVYTNIRVCCTQGKDGMRPFERQYVCHVTLCVCLTHHERAAGGACGGGAPRGRDGGFVRGCPRGVSQVKRELD